MKKLFAILLAALMLASSACAESAVTFKLADPAVNIDMSGQNIHFDLTGLELAVATGMAGEMSAARIDINGNGDKLMGATVNVTADRCVIAVDGVSTPLYVTLPAVTNELSGSDLSGLNIDIESLTNTLISQMEISTEGDTTAFKLPYTAVNEVLASVLPALQSKEIGGMDAEKLAGELTKLEDSNSGINIEGSYTAADAGISAIASVIPVTDGTAAEIAVINLSVSTGDAVDVVVEAPGSGTLHFALTPTGDGAASLSASVTAEGLNGEFTARVSVSESDASLPVIENQEKAINLEESISEETMQALIGELYAAAGPLITFVNAVLAQPAG